MALKAMDKIFRRYAEYQAEKNRLEGEIASLEAQKSAQESAADEAAASGSLEEYQEKRPPQKKPIRSYM